MNALERVSRVVLRAYGAKGQRVHTSQGSMFAYSIEGRGTLDPIVLVHGIGSAATAFTRMVPLLIPHTQRLIAVELPGHGNSPRPQMGMLSTAFFQGFLELMDGVISTKAIVVGCSLGGFSSIRYAIDRPNKVSMLVLCSPGGAYMEPGAFDAFLDTFRIQTRQDARRFLDKLLSKQPWYSPVIEHYVLQQFLRPELQEAIRLATHDSLLKPSELSRIEVPTRIIWGQSDQLLPRENLEFFRAHLPTSAEIVEPPGFSHVPHVERPRALSKLILDFAERTAKRTS